ncbi:hypothetical protein K523DRAFT_162616 [Schizophyllum commune Tattone D]|nr:hypothetical protein K523DRAFT_162616 [Schizophyllum commune Tattone D]
MPRKSANAPSSPPNNAEIGQLNDLRMSSLLTVTTDLSSLSSQSKVSRQRQCILVLWGTSHEKRARATRTSPASKLRSHPCGPMSDKYGDRQSKGAHQSNERNCPLQSRMFSSR